MNKLSQTQFFYIIHSFGNVYLKTLGKRKEPCTKFIQILSQYGHIFSAVWLHSLIHMSREIKIRCLQNENPGSSPARPWYYAGNIKSIPRFRHLSPPKKKKRKKSFFCLELQTACLKHRSLLAQTRCLSYWDEEIPVRGHSWENPLLFSLTARWG